MLFRIGIVIAPSVGGKKLDAGQAAYEPTDPRRRRGISTGFRDILPRKQREARTIAIHHIGDKRPDVSKHLHTGTVLALTPRGGNYQWLF